MEPNILNDDLPVTGNAHIDHWLALAGALVPLLSFVASMLNAKVRNAQVAGQELSPAMLQAASIVNLLAVNLDKAKQLGALAKGKPVPTTTRGLVVNGESAQPVSPAVPQEPVKPE